MGQAQAAQTYSFAVEADGDTRIVSIAGSLCEEYNREAKESFLKVLEEKPKKIVVDLSRLDYVSSSGIAVLVSVLCRCRRENCWMALCGLKKDIYELLRLTRLTQVFEIFEDRKAALEASATAGGFGS